jgi:hypothetical protein
LFIMLLVGHGIAHLAGFVVPWKLMSLADLPYRTTVFGHRLDVGNIGVRVAGLLWLVTGATFIVLACAVWTMASWWYQVLLGTVALSVAMCVVEWPHARAGIIANLVILGLTAMLRHQTG